MRSVLVAIAVAIVGAVADPCMGLSDGELVAYNYVSLMTDYSNATAEKVLCTDFHEYSDSYNFIVNHGCPDGPLPLDSTTFFSREAFEAAQSMQPAVRFDVLNIWNNCNTVFVRFRINRPGPVQPEQQVDGMVALQAVYVGGDEQPWLIDTVFSEFNSGAWLYDFGGFVPTCSDSSKRRQRRGTIL